MKENEKHYYACSLTEYYKNGISMLDTSQENVIGDIWKMWSGKNHTISKIYKSVELQRCFSPGITSISSGPPFLGSDVGSPTYWWGDLEKHPVLYDLPIPHHYVKWG